MNKEQTKEAALVMLAWADGKRIRHRPRWAGKWLVAGDHAVFTWNWDEYEYEIAPEPKIIYVNEYRNGEVNAFAEESSAKDATVLAQSIAVPYVRLSDVGLLK